MGRRVALVLSLAVVPALAQATTACQDFYQYPAEVPLSCNGAQIDTGVINSTNYSHTLNNYACDTQNEPGSERIFKFTCAYDTFATVSMLNTDCDIDIFVLGADCSTTTDCLASNTETYTAGGHWDVTWFCEQGLTYYVSIEAWAPSDSIYHYTCPNLTDGINTGVGSRFSLTTSCAEVCNDGLDNDRDTAIDCQDPDCANDPHCRPPEDCTQPGDEDGDGLSDCDDPDCWSTVECCDADDDGVEANTGLCGFGGDCNDHDGSIYPGAPEQIADGVDQDCDGGDDCYLDADHDHYGVNSVVHSADLSCTDVLGEADVATDCDDGAASVHPGAAELAGDGVDQDCDGVDMCYVDSDRDHYGAALTRGVDLTCDEGGLAAVGGDCDDAARAIHPGAVDTPVDGVDQDCDGGDTCFTDADDDGWGSSVTTPSPNLICGDQGVESARAGDCDDSSRSVSPDGVEIPYDGIDQDCNGSDLTDVDHDGVSAIGFGGTDCDDRDASIHPGATEIPADGIDQDCDGVDSCWRDADDDEHGTTTVVDGSSLDCSTGTGVADVADDCDDHRASVHPGATEIPYDGIDQDCSGADLDDLDQDGFPGGSFGTDCDDQSPHIHPGATEIADGADEDCDGIVDEGTAWYDDDGDGFTEEGGDCDDASAARHPGAPEIENGVDDDCDGITDEGTRAYDDDGDGYTEEQGDCNDGDARVHPGASELLPEGFDANCDGAIPGVDADGDHYAPNGGDCDDSDPAVFPGAVETPNGVDDNCNGVIDENTIAYDDDRDGYSEEEGDCDDADPNVNPAAAESPDNGIDDNCNGVVDEGGPRVDDDGDGYSELFGDCDDADPDVHPYATEIANGIDDNCNQEVDENLGDDDGDGWTEAQGDCDDADGWTYPHAKEVCDGVDNDCDGQIDEDACPDAPSDTPPATGKGGCDLGGRGGLDIVGLIAGVVVLRRRRPARRPSPTSAGSPGATPRAR